MRISAIGGVIRSLGGIGQSDGCVIEVEQPAISHAIAHSHIFDFVTIDKSNNIEPTQMSGFLSICELFTFS